MSHYPYLLLVDFEIVEGKNACGKTVKEIIEFSWVVYDTDQRMVVDFACTYVKPEEITVSEDVLADLGIDIEAPGEAVTLGDAIQKFDSAMFNQFQATRKPVAIGCFYSNKFTRTFREIADAKDISLFMHYSHYIDIAQILKNQFPQLKGKNLNNVRAIAAQLGVEVHGTRPNGLHACYTTANLLSRYLEEANITKDHNILVTAEQTQASTSGGGPPSPSNKRLAFLRCRGCPWNVTEDQIVGFVAPCATIEPKDVRIVVGSDGRTTGEVYVAIPTAEERDNAIKDLHGKMIGRRWIEVFRASEEEFNKAGREKRSSNTTNNHVAGHSTSSDTKHTSAATGGLRLRGLPWTSNEGDIVKFFKDAGFNISVEDIIMGYAEKNRLTGEAWVQMLSSDTAAKAMAALQRKIMGNRYIEIFPASPPEIQQARTYRGHNHSCGGPIRQNAHGAAPQYGFTVLRMRGLPYQANEQHICEFFNGYHMTAILPSTAPLNGKPSGEAYVQFHNAEEAYRAYQKCNGQHIDRRYIELFAANKAEMDYAAAGADPRMIRERNVRPY